MGEVININRPRFVAKLNAPAFFEPTEIDVILGIVERDGDQWTMLHYCTDERQDAFEHAGDAVLALRELHKEYMAGLRGRLEDMQEEMYAAGFNGEIIFFDNEETD